MIYSNMDKNQTFLFIYNKHFVEMNFFYKIKK